jgi:hypothetical protein
MKFTIYWHASRYGRHEDEHEVAQFNTWNDARTMLPLIDTGGIRQYFATIDDGLNYYNFLVTKGAGPLEVISMQDYPNLSIDDVLLI